MERVDFILKEFSNFKIPLQNKELNLNRCFMIQSCQSRIKEYLFRTQEYRGLERLSLNVDEKKILLTTLGIKHEFQTEELLDYFIFFRSLGMKREMKLMIGLLSKEDDLVKLYEELRKVSEYENETIKSWFSEGVQKSSLPSPIGIDTFKTSYCLLLFNKLKKEISKLQNNNILSKFAGTFGYVLGGLLSYPEILNPTYHSDFVGVDFDYLSVLKLFRHLYLTEETCNMKLKSTDGTEFPCHREMLVYRMEYFMRMFRFYGSEREELMEKEMPVIQIEDLDSKTLRCVLDFVYLGKLNENAPISLIVYVLNTTRKYLAPKLEEVIINALRIRIKAQKYNGKEDIVRILKDPRNSEILHRDEEIWVILLPLLRTWSGNSFGIKKMKKVIRKGFEHLKTRSKISELEKELKEEREKREGMESHLEVITQFLIEKKIVDDKELNKALVESGERKRKRKDDDDSKNGEPKRRKKE